MSLRVNIRLQVDTAAGRIVDILRVPSVADRILQMHINFDQAK